MTTFGTVSVLSAGLELCVPSYALRLVRRFGASQTGSFVIIAFVCLAVLHLVNPIKPSPGSGLALSMVYAGASVLLLIGMGHTETVCRQRVQAQIEEENLRRKIDAEARERADHLGVIKQQMAQEIVRLQQQVEALALSERQFRLLFVQHPHPMWIFDLRTGRILAGNEAALSQYGYTQQEFTSLSAKELIAKEANAAFLAEAARPCSCPEPKGIWRHRRKDRTPVDVEVMAVDLRFADSPARLIFAEDVSPRVRRETELCEHERTRVLRRTAEGVAHHFGQILTSVEGQVGLLREGRQDTAEVEQLEQVLRETRRGSALVRQLLAVGGCETPQLQPLDLNRWLLGQQSIVRRMVGERVSVEFQLTEGLPPVLADTRSLELILYNLVLNAREALPQGGCIEIRSDTVWIDPRQVQRLAHASPGHFIRFTVSDNGQGMPTEVQEHLFEPFFTTRENRKAMGLGLAGIYGAAKQMGGWVDFTSQPHRGTAFSVYVPVAQLTIQVGTTQTPALPPPTRGTILLVEADDRVRDLTRHILRRNGYRVVEADLPSTALLLMEAQAKDIDLLLTDFRFQDGSSGLALADQFRLVKNDLKIIYSTAPLGPEDTHVLQEAKLLFKPYTPDQLLQVIGACLA